MVKRSWNLSNPYVRFCLIWLLMFVLYFPAAKAGFVADFSGWLEQVKYHRFLEVINRTNFIGQSLYQFTQFNTWVFYKLFGIHEWLWHLLFITLHVINCSLLFNLCNNLMRDAGIEKSPQIAFTGIVLFCISPYLSETVVWEPSFHFLQGLLLILLVLNLAYLFIKSGQKKYALYAGIIYFLSTFSLEIFYITPWLALIMGFYCQYNSQIQNNYLKNTILYFFLPGIFMFFLHLVLFRLVYGSWVAHIGTGAITSANFIVFGRPLKYLFHLLFLGRFFPNDLRQKVYSFCDTKIVIYFFLAIVTGITIYIIATFRKMSGKGKVISLLYIWMLVTLAILVPLWFYDILYVIYDRYVYFAGAFFYMLFALLVSTITIKYIRIGVLSLFVLANLRFAILVIRYWSKSARVISNLVHTIPDERNKTIILLNIPQCMNGIAMIGAEKNSEFKLLHDLLLPDKLIKVTLYDCIAYNMTTPDDGAHTRVIDDSTVLVTMNQWGTWWWFGGMGGYNYENNDYKIELMDGGSTGGSYKLKLKGPSSNFLLLFSRGGNWKAVDMNNKSWDQY